MRAIFNGRLQSEHTALEISIYHPLNTTNIHPNINFINIVIDFINIFLALGSKV